MPIVQAPSPALLPRLASQLRRGTQGRPALSSSTPTTISSRTCPQPDVAHSAQPVTTALQHPQLPLDVAFLRCRMMMGARHHGATLGRDRADSSRARLIERHCPSCATPSSRVDRPRWYSRVEPAVRADCRTDRLSSSSRSAPHRVDSGVATLCIPFSSLQPTSRAVGDVSVRTSRVKPGRFARDRLPDHSRDAPSRVGPVLPLGLKSNDIVQRQSVTSSRSPPLDGRSRCASRHADLHAGSGAATVACGAYRRVADPAKPHPSPAPPRDRTSPSDPKPPPAQPAPR